MHVIGYRLPGFVVAFAPLLPILALAVYARTRSASKPQRAALGLYVAGLVGALLLTVSPGGNAGRAAELALAERGGGCRISLAGVSLQPWREDQRMLNVALFVPLGLLAVLMIRHRRWPLALILATPLLVEYVQLRAPALGRACDAVDVLDNLTGVVLGAFLGWAALLVARRRVA